MEVAFLEPEQVRRLKSDFRFVADYLVQTRTGGQYVPSDAQIDHVDETLKLMGALTGDNRFQRSINDLMSEGKERISMRTVIDDYIDRRHAEYETIIADKERALADSKRALADSKRALADKDRALADKDREIQELKARLGIA